MSVPAGQTALHSAALRLFREGRMAFVQVAPDGIVHGTEGGEAFGVTLGQVAADALPVLAGLGEHLAALPLGESLAFPNISWQDQQGRQYVASLSILRDPEDRSLHIWLTDARETADLQQRLVQKHNELALAQMALAAARDQAQAANRAKSAFLTHISHELRSPLNVIIGNTEILAQDLPAAAAPYLADIRTAGEHLLSLVTDLLDLAKAEAGRLDLLCDWVDLPALVQEAIRLSQALPRGSALSWRYQQDDALAPIWADARRLRQILLNLLSNAVKFAHEHIQLTLFLADGQICLHISDDGPGLSEAEISRLGEVLLQFEAGRRHGGSGLGIAISMALAKAHGGQLSFAPQPTGGLRAMLTLPMKAQS